MNNIQFTVGAPATHTIWTDRRVGEIVEVSPAGTRVKFRPHLQQFRGLDACGNQVFDIQASPDSSVVEFSLRKNGVWKIVGQHLRSPGGTLSGGHHPYYDESF